MAQAKSFSIKEAVGVGWKMVTSNLGFFIPLCLAVLGVSIGVQMVVSVIQSAVASAGDESGWLFIVVSILTVVLNVFVQLLVGLGVVRVSLDVIENKTRKISALFTQKDKVLRALFANILMVIPLVIVGAITLGVSIAVFAGALPNIPFLVPILLIVLFIVFAVWWQIRLQFFMYFLVDREAKIVASLKDSFEVTRGHFWKLFFFGIVLALVNLLGMLALLVGLFITVPLTWIATAYVYRRLAQK